MPSLHPKSVFARTAWNRFGTDKARTSVRDRLHASSGTFLYILAADAGGTVVRSERKPNWSVVKAYDVIDSIEQQVIVIGMVPTLVFKKIFNLFRRC